MFSSVKMCLMYGLTVVLVVLLQEVKCQISETYIVTTKKQSYSPHYSWEEVEVAINNETQHKEQLSLQLQPPNPKEAHQVNVSEVTNSEVFVSLTTISSRVQTVNNSIITMLHGVLVPTHIFLFLSRTPYLIDKGVLVVPDNLLCLVAEGSLTIVYTENTGPHRKLLPLLSRFTSSSVSESFSVAIVNVDDDMPYTPNSGLLYQLVAADTRHGGAAVIALRARRIGLCEIGANSSSSASISGLTNHSSSSSSSSVFSPDRLDNHSNHHHQFTKYSGWGLTYSYGRKEMLVLPTGTGGVLYRPHHFHPVVFSEGLRNVTGTGDDLMFRLACMANGVSVVTACREPEGRALNRPRRCGVDVDQMVKRFKQSKVSNSGGDAVGESESVGSDTHPSILTAEQQYQEQMSSLDDTRRIEGGVGGDLGDHAPEGVSSTGAEKNVVVEEYFRTTRNLLRGSSSSPVATNKQQSLYAINRRGRNDEQWSSAIAYLEQHGVVSSFRDLVSENYLEREESCYAPGKKTNRTACSLYVCVSKESNER